MIQPSGLAGLRQASTRPTTANAADAHTGTEPLLAFRFCRASPDSGTAAAYRPSSTPPTAMQAARDVSRMLPTNAHGTRGAFRKRYRSYGYLVSHA